MTMPYNLDASRFQEGLPFFLNSPLPAVLIRSNFVVFIPNFMYGSAVSTKMGSP